MKVHYRLKCSEVECCRLPPCRAGAEPTVHKLQVAAVFGSLC